jgi:glycosyltransferase involved in cell wall biosynthesis
MPPLPISVCLISGAEAHRIGRTLASVHGWVAEIIVVLNQEAIDGTEEICLQQGVRVFRETWKGHVRQKNSAADKASQPWIFGLDADEVVTPELRRELTDLLSQPTDANPGVAAFSVPRLSFYAGQWIRHGDWYPDRKTRLWRRGYGRWTGLDPHDFVEAEGAVRALRSPLEHYSYDNLDHHVAKLRSYADISAHEALKAGKKARLADLVFRPPWRFIRGFLIRRGFLDGTAGFQIAWMTALLAFLKYARMRELERESVAGHHTR